MAGTVLILLPLLLAEVQIPVETVPLMPFGPALPSAAGPDHPYYHAIAIAPIEGMPSSVGGNWITLGKAVSKPAEIDKALASALASLNYIAPDPAQARYRLSPHWQGLVIPAKLSMSTTATAIPIYIP